MILSCLYKHVVFGVGCKDAKPNSDGEFQVPGAGEQNAGVIGEWMAGMIGGRGSWCGRNEENS